MLSSVVDDYEMGVTHIIRGDDHLNNVSTNSIIKYMSWKEHLCTYSFNSWNRWIKIIQRHGATNVFEYNNMGYLSHAMFSYLLQLGCHRTMKTIIKYLGQLNYLILKN